MLVVITSCVSTAETTRPPDNPTLLANLIKASNPTISGLVVSADNSDPSKPRIIIAGLTNSVSEVYTANINIDQSQGITTDPVSFTVSAENLISPHTGTRPLRVTFEGDAAVSYTVTTQIRGSAVGDWIATDKTGDYITVSFAGQGGRLSITGTTLSITSLTNSPTGDVGTITFEKLPAGFTAEPRSITLPNPDGTGTATITPDPTTFKIIETDNAENSAEYTIAPIELAGLIRFTPGLHIKITEDGNLIEGLTITERANPNGLPTVHIEGLTNKIDKTMGTPNQYALAIEEVPGLFTLPSGTPITRIITEPTDDLVAGVGTITDGMMPASSFTVTNNDDGISRTYMLEEISFSAYRSPLTAANITATYGGNTAASSDITIEDNVITISGFLNRDLGTAETGTVTITEPTGYTVTPSTLSISDPDGSSATNKVLDQIIVANTSMTERVPHQVIIQFSSLSVSITSADINASSPLVIASGVTIPITTTVCQLLATPTVTVVGIAGSKVADVTPFPRYYDRERDMLTGGMFVVTRGLTLEASDGALISTGFKITLKFPACTTFAGGTGVDADNAYQIDNAPRLELLSHLVSNDNANYGDGTFYEIIANIDMGLPGLPFSERGSKTPDGVGSNGNGFLPIGKQGVVSNFGGTLDCGSKIISGLYINRPNRDHVGFMGYTTDASIKDCYLTDVNVKGSSHVGGLVGRSTDSSSISGSYVTGSVSGVSNYIGGLVGWNYKSAISDSYATGDVLAEGGRAGGLVGDNYISTISDSYANVNISGEFNIGGLVGASATGSGSTGVISIISNSYATGAVSGRDYVGGLVGTGQTSDSMITNSYATGSVTGQSSLGGLVGWSSYSALIRDSYATGSVTGTSSNVGSLVGWLYQNSMISNSYAIGVVSGRSSVGGLVGAKDRSTTSVTTSYWDETIGGSSSPGGGTGRTTVQMQVSAPITMGSDAVYVGWNTSIWNFTSAKYPRLKTVVCANRQYNEAATDCTDL